MTTTAPFCENVMAALGVVVLERIAERRFRAIANAPAWFARFQRAGDVTREAFALGDEASFLANFVIDAEAFWAGDGRGRFGSGLWSEGDGAGQPHQFEAFAVRAGTLSLLLVSRLPEDEYQQRQAVFQTAREAMLRSGGRAREPGLIGTSAGTPAGTPGAARNLTELRRGDSGHYDSQTGLPNRALFEKRLAHQLKALLRPQQMLCVLLVSIDRFDQIARKLGPAGAGLMLQLFAARLWTCLRDSDTVARFGEQQFAVLITATTEPQNLVRMVSTLQDVLRPAFDCGQHSVSATTSIGGALTPDSGGTAAQLLDRALTALAQAGQQGGNGYSFDVQGIDAAVARRLSLDNDLRRAIERQQFVLHYHPRIDLKSGRIVGMEALVRWQAPGRGLVAPLDFVPLAEQTGLIVPIGEWVLRHACRQLRIWQTQGLSPLLLSVNLSVRQLEHPGWVDTLRGVLAESGLTAADLELELTESAVMKDIAVSLSALHETKRLGVGLSIDDFGTGHSSLGYLKQLPFDVLKIDRSFIQDIATSTTDAAIVAAIITVARLLKLRTVAEGVTSQEQLSVLVGLGCDEVQGFLFSPPLAADDFAAFARKSLGRPAGP